MGTYVVVGAGLVGAATAWQLARRGHEVTVLERRAPANAEGSSHGSARILRYGYADPFYVQMVVDATREWRELEHLSGERLVTRTGSLDAGAARDPAALAAVLARVGVDHELLTAAEAAARWPQFRFGDGGGDVLWHPAAGVVDAEAAVKAMLRLARAEGARVETGRPVVSVERVGTGHRVVSLDGRAEQAEKVVVAAGGWLPDLLGDIALPDSLLAAFPPLQVMQENAYHFPYHDVSEEPWPTFIHKESDMLIYGLPGGRDAALPGGGSGQKVAEFNGGRPIRSAAAQTGAIDPANRERIVAYVRQALPGVVPEPYAETTCLFTNTPTEDFVVDGAGGLTVASPCSGHGAKFAPLLGRIIAEEATDERPAPDRFRVRAGRGPAFALTRGLRPEGGVDRLICRCDGYA